jgi:hypothetical protein
VEGSDLWDTGVTARDRSSGELIKLTGEPADQGRAGQIQDNMSWDLIRVDLIGFGRGTVGHVPILAPEPT